MQTAIILFAHGARDPEWANPMRRVQAAVRAKAPGLQVELAFLEFMTPDLPACVDALARAGAQRILVLPMFIARGGHLKREVPEMIEALRASHPGIGISLAGAVGEHATVIEAMASAAVAMIGSELA